MHVDGAFGASALLSDSLREHLAGIENSDSLSAPSSLGIVNFRYVGHGDLSEEK